MRATRIFLDAGLVAIAMFVGILTYSAYSNACKAPRALTVHMGSVK